MSDNAVKTGFDRLFVRNMLESALRIGAVLILLSMTYDIVRPFILPLLWGGIIAIAAFPLTRWLQGKLGGRRGLDIPMPVILMGAIGGMLAYGIFGLFTGAVLLSILYKLFGEWQEQESY